MGAACIVFSASKYEQNSGEVLASSVSYAFMVFKFLHARSHWNANKRVRWFADFDCRSFKHVVHKDGRLVIVCAGRVPICVLSTVGDEGWFTVKGEHAEKAHFGATNNNLEILITPPHPFLLSKEPGCRYWNLPILAPIFRDFTFFNPPCSNKQRSKSVAIQPTTPWICDRQGCLTHAACERLQFQKQLSFVLMSNLTVCCRVLDAYVMVTNSYRSVGCGCWAAIMLYDHPVDIDSVASKLSAFDQCFQAAHRRTKSAGLSKKNEAKFPHMSAVFVQILGPYNKLTCQPESTLNEGGWPRCMIAGTNFVTHFIFMTNCQIEHCRRYPESIGIHSACSQIPYDYAFYQIGYRQDNSFVEAVHCAVKTVWMFVVVTIYTVHMRHFRPGQIHSGFRRHDCPGRTARCSRLFRKVMKLLRNQIVEVSNMSHISDALSERNAT
ncbi:hypothetical protein CLF_110462 [Clonorchis sinensis]|uniref:Uncharacterized protein n=1 Tax=Clonorchis sinensis TaxID=79923 RepID=G7YTJ2_CLOSI|nr:hypothetical protein CLF_110462 [Clonorchis sinensis]